jgi:low temperature requirement protein LtrA
MPENSHRLRRMSGRDPHERHRAATPLELLFDLMFVVAFGAAGNELDHALGYEAIGHRHLQDHLSKLRA